MRRSSVVRVLYASAAILVLLQPSAQAQYDENRAVYERMDRLERDLMLLQRQLARGETARGGGASPLEPGADSAQTEVRLTQMEEDMRALRGQAEENGFQVRQLSETVEKMQRDTEFRFNELSAHPAAGTAEPVEPPAAAAEGEPKSIERKPINSPDKGAAKSSRPVEPNDDTVPPPAETTAGSGTLKVIKVEDLDTPREHYNHAFRLLNQTRYEDASTYFKSFTEKYPKDPLIGNAYYWLGETYYIKRDYVAAADQFRQGFEALPNGPKASDNLLKLALSLNAMKKDKESCIVLEQLLVKFKTASTNVTKKAQQERNRIGCK